jgi:hypothetical protein
MLKRLLKDIFGYKTDEEVRRGEYCTARDL